MKWRVCYAEKKITQAQNLQIERELDDLSYTCGGCFQDMSEIEDSVFKLVFVNDKLTCAAPMEVPYYATFTDPLCFFCGNEDDLQIQDGYYPLCNRCHEEGYSPKKKITRAFAKSKP